MNNLIKLLIGFTVIFFVANCSQSKNELFDITDSFVTSLETTHDSYSILNGTDYKKFTSDSFYQVMPVGRLINVKIMESVSEDVYKELEKKLEGHYENDKRVNGVYISNGGTIMIDCRN